MSEKLDNYNPGIDRVWKSLAQKQSLETSPSAEKEPQFNIVRYNDGETALYFTGSGDELVFGTGKDSVHNPLNPEDIAIIQTESEQQYGFGKGLVLTETGKSYELPQADFSVTIGKQAQIAGELTSKINGILVRLQGESSENAPGVMNIDQPNPFKDLEQELAIRSNRKTQIWQRWDRSTPQ